MQEAALSVEEVLKWLKRYVSKSCCGIAGFVTTLSFLRDIFDMLG
jgi:hypothetical protein